MSKQSGQPRQSGSRHVYLPQVARLRPGDVLLTSNAESASRKSGIESELIRAATGGRFTHALICSAPPAFIEAIGPGTSVLSLMRCFAHSRENVRVLRHPDASIAQRAASFAQREVGRDYSIPRAVQSVFSSETLAKVDDHGVFCSALVAQSFVAAGAPEFTATPVDKTTPATIDRMTGLVDVTDEIFESALAPSNIEALTALDGDAAPTLSSSQTEISNRYAKVLLPEAERLAREHEGFERSVVPTLNGLLELILLARDAISDVAPSSQQAFCRGIDELDERLADLIGSGEMLRLMQDIVRADGETNRHALHQSFRAHPDINVQSMKGFLDTTRTELATRRAAYAELTEWERGRSKAMREYLKMEDLVITNIAAREPLLEEILERIG